MIGGVQINTGPRTADYFLPLSFELKRAGAGAFVDLLPELQARARAHVRECACVFVCLGRELGACVRACTCARVCVGRAARSSAERRGARRARRRAFSAFSTTDKKESLPADVCGGPRHRAPQTQHVAQSMTACSIARSGSGNALAADAVPPVPTASAVSPAVATPAVPVSPAAARGLLQECVVVAPAAPPPARPVRNATGGKPVMPNAGERGEREN